MKLAARVENVTKTYDLGPALLSRWGAPSRI